MIIVKIRSGASLEEIGLKARGQVAFDVLSELDGDYDAAAKRLKTSLPTLYKFARIGGYQFRPYTFKKQKKKPLSA
jgi:hypothetical protein